LTPSLGYIRHIKQNKTPRKRMTVLFTTSQGHHLVCSSVQLSEFFLSVYLIYNMHGFLLYFSGRIGTNMPNPSSKT
jgi:hypothetical protein